MKSATSGAASASSFGESRATCSISSLKLTAPALHLDGENFTDHSPQQPLEAGVFQVGQNPHRLLLIRIQQPAAAIRHLQLGQQFPQMFSITIGGHALPEFGKQLEIFALGALCRQSEGKRGAKSIDIAAVRLVRKVLNVVANLIGDAQRL